MTSFASNNAEKIQIKQRSPIGKVLLWGTVGLLLLIGTYEAISCHFYQSSFSAMLAANLECQRVERVAGLNANELSQLVKGFPFQYEYPASTVNGQTYGRKLVYHWPSLYGNYRIAVLFDDQNRVLQVDNSQPSDKSSGQKNIGSASNVVSKPLPQEGLATTSDQTFVLATDEPSIVESMRKARLGSLGRELFRQSVLIAARDELGIGTLDASLGEMTLVQEAPNAYPFHLDVTLTKESHRNQLQFVVHLSRAIASGEWFKWSSSPVPVSSDPGLDGLLQTLEPMSRGEFVTALKEAGLQQSSERAHEPVTVSETFPHRIDFVAQYAVLRQRHAERQSQGETIENLGALVVAYANLGNLIDFHWSPMAKVFKARALIYAQRMLAKYGNTAVTLAHRSYAWTMVGNHILALQDAKAAHQLTPIDVPKWLPLTEAFCEYAPTILDDAEGELRELGAYLKMRLLHPYHELQAAVPAIEVVLKQNPACSRAIERMHETRTLGQIRTAAEGLADQCWWGIYDRLAEIPDMPAKVLAIAKRHRKPPKRASAWFGGNAGKEYLSRAKMLSELKQAASIPADQAELSWTVLAEMLSDLCFVQSERAITSQYQTLGFTLEQTAETVRRVTPLVANHRLGKFLNFYTNDRPTSLASLTSVVNGTKPTYYELHCLPIANASYQANPAFYQRLNVDIDNHWDKTQDDLLRAIDSAYPVWQQEAWNWLVEISPHHPLSIARVIHKSPEFTDQKALEWETKYAGNGYVLLELGRKYLALGRSTDAVRCMVRSIEVSPSYEACFKLADEYERREEFLASEKTLESALKIPSYGLEEGNTHKKLAGLLMYQGHWEEAEPHAQLTAQTYSSGGLVTAARCAEGLKEWKKAETYQRANSERYESSSGDSWYFSCVRLNRGDLKASRVLAEKYWKSFVPPLRMDQMWSVGLGQIIDGDPRKAIETFTNPQSVHHHSPHQFLVAAVLADRLGDAAKRDSLFGEIEKRFGAYYAHVQLVNLFRNALRQPDKLHWNRYSFYELTDDLNYNDVCFVYYCAGEFLATHGEEELSREYLDCAATTYDVHRNTCLLANLAMRARKIEVEETRLNRQPDNRIPFLTYLWRAYRDRNERKYDDARTNLDQALRVAPDFISGLLARGKLSEFEGRYADALADYEAILKINSDSENAHRSLCILQASCPLDEIRNGEKALEHARRCHELSITKTGNEHWLLAISHAECGDFQKAIQFQEEAIKRIPTNTEWPKQLALYREGKSVRFPHAAAGNSAAKSDAPTKEQ